MIACHGNMHTSPGLEFLCRGIGTHLPTSPSFLLLGHAHRLTSVAGQMLDPLAFVVCAKGKKRGRMKRERGGGGEAGRERKRQTDRKTDRQTNA